MASAISSARSASVGPLESAAFAFSYASCAAASVPVRLQRVRYQAVVGIDLEETALRQICFVARPLYVLASQPIRFLVAAREFLLHRQRDFDCQRRHPLDHYFADGSIERTAVHGLT